MITTILQGRAGNQFYILATLLAHAKKNNLEYYIPDRAYHCDGSKMYFPHLAMGSELQGLQEYHEQAIHAVAKGNGTYNYNVPAYHTIPDTDDTKLVGYWQSFKYFDDHRDYILEKFQLPYVRFAFVGIHIRRGDFLQLKDKHPDVPFEYYRKAMQYFVDLGKCYFIIFSDDLEWCENIFAKKMFESIIGIKSMGLEGVGNDTLPKFNIPELNALVRLSSCEHQILCYSTFGFVAAWLNQNPDKIVLIPPKKYIFGGANADMIPDYFTQLEFE